MLFLQQPIVVQLFGRAAHPDAPRRADAVLDDAGRRRLDPTRPRGGTAGPSTEPGTAEPLFAGLDEAAGTDDAAVVRRALDRLTDEVPRVDLGLCASCASHRPAQVLAACRAAAAALVPHTEDAVVDERARAALTVAAFDRLSEALFSGERAEEHARRRPLDDRPEG